MVEDGTLRRCRPYENAVRWLHTEGRNRHVKTVDVHVRALFPWPQQDVNGCTRAISIDDER